MYEKVEQTDGGLAIYYKTSAGSTLVATFVNRGDGEEYFDRLPKSQPVDESQRLIARLSLTRPALDRLLGGDTELEIRLRHQIVKDFTSHKLVPLLKAPEIESLLNNLKGQTIRMIEEQIGKVPGYYTKTNFALTPEFEAKVRAKVNDAVSAVLGNINIADRVLEYIKDRESYWMSYVDRKLADLLEKGIENKIRDGINERLAKAAQP